MATRSSVRSQIGRRDSQPGRSAFARSSPTRRRPTRGSGGSSRASICSHRSCSGISPWTIRCDGRSPITVGSSESGGMPCTSEFSMLHTPWSPAPTRRMGTSGSPSTIRSCRISEVRSLSTLRMATLRVGGSTERTSTWTSAPLNLQTSISVAATPSPCPGLDWSGETLIRSQCWAGCSGAMLRRGAKRCSDAGRRGNETRAGCVARGSGGSPGWFGLPHSHSFLPRRSRPLESPSDSSGGRGTMALSR